MRRRKESNWEKEIGGRLEIFIREVKKWVCNLGLTQ